MAVLGQSGADFNADYITEQSNEEKLEILNQEEKEIQSLIGKFQTWDPNGVPMNDNDVEKLIKYFNAGKLRNVSSADLQKMAAAIAKSTVMTPPEHSKYTLNGGSIKDMDKVKQKMLDLASKNKNLLNDVVDFEKLTDLQLQAQAYLQLGQLKGGKSLEDLKKEIKDRINNERNKETKKKLNKQLDALSPEKHLESEAKYSTKKVYATWFGSRMYYDFKSWQSKKKYNKHPLQAKTNLMKKINERSLLITSLEGKVAGRGFIRNWGAKIKLGWERKKQAKEQTKLNTMLTPDEINKRLEVLNAKLQTLNVNGMATATMIKRAEQAKALIAAEAEQLNTCKAQKLQTWETTKSEIKLDYNNGMNNFRAQMAENSMDIAKREEWLARGSKYQNLLKHMTPEQQQIFREAIKANGGGNENFEKSLTMDNDFLTQLNQVLPPEEREKVSHMIEDFKRVSEGTYQPTQKEQELFDNRIELNVSDDIDTYKKALQDLTHDGQKNFTLDENSDAEFKAKAIIAAHELGLEIVNFDRMKYNSGELAKDGLTPDTLEALERVEKDKASKAVDEMQERDMSKGGEVPQTVINKDKIKEGRKLHAAFDAVKKQVAKESLNKDGSYSERKANKMMFDIVKAASTYNKETYEYKDSEAYKKLSPEAKKIVDDIQLVRKHDKAKADKESKKENPITLSQEEQEAYKKLSGKKKNDLKVQGRLISELSGRTVKRQKEIVKRNMNINSMQRNNLISKER